MFQYIKSSGRIRDMSIVKQETPEHFIIASGSAFTFKNEPLKLEFNLDSNFQHQVDVGDKLRLEIHFLNDVNQGQKINGEVVTENQVQVMKISVYNVDGIGGTTTPLLIAENNTTNKKTFISIGFQKAGDSVLTNYTIFLEK